MSEPVVADEVGSGRGGRDRVVDANERDEMLMGGASPLSVLIRRCALLRKEPVDVLLIGSGGSSASDRDPRRR